MSKQKVNLNNLIDTNTLSDKPKEKKVMMTLTIDKKTRAEIKIEAVKLGLQMNTFIEKLFDDYKKNQENK